MDDDKLLLAEYRYFSDAFWKNEATGEKRVEFFITLATAVIAGIVALMTRSGEVDTGINFPLIVAGALSALLLFGLITYARMLQRNRVTDEFKKIIDYLREQLKDRSTDLTDYKVPFRESKRWFKGGLAETVALMNSIIIGIMAALYLYFEEGWHWSIIPYLFLLSFIIQFVYAKYDREMAKKESTETREMAGKKKADTRPQTFRANVGAVIVNADGLVLALERKKIPGSWQLPQGGLDEGEEPQEAVRREIREETGIETVHLELLATTPRWLAYELPEESRSQKTGRGQVQKWFLFRFTGLDEAITMGDGKEFRAWEWTSMQALLSKVVAFKQPVYQELGEYFKKYLNE